MDLGDLVVFGKDPLLYGVLRVGVKTADRRLVCEPAHPAVPHHRRRPEVFFTPELTPYVGPVMVDLAAVREERETEAAQDADADETEGMGT